MAHDRREVLRCAAVALLVPGFCALPRRARAAGGSFDPPAEPMIYTRRVERSLAGGAQFRVSRSFAVRFVAEPAGFRVDGEQVGVEVDAPEALARFADLERKRVERALFPLHLDRSGVIAGGLDYEKPPQLEQAVEEVLARLARLALPEPAQAEAASFVSAVHVRSEALVSQLPPDLFAPTRERSSATRSFALPGGEQGQVSVTYMAEAEPETGLMRNASREVVTRLDATRRETVERWTLVPHG